MKRILLFSFIVMSLLVIAGCQNNKKSQKEETKILNKNIDRNHIIGTYFGVLPCASCPGINTLIVLNEDCTYEKTVEYLESDDSPKTTKGKFIRDENSNIISIGKNFYLVKENQLIVLNNNKEVIKGELAENYILTKTELEPPLDSNEGYTLQMFVGSDDKNYNIIFNANPSIPTALIESGDFKKMLSQTISRAKGAEYLGSDVKLILKDNKATLFIKGNKIGLKQK